jgi:NADPH2:quinone reductase
LYQLLCNYCDVFSLNLAPLFGHLISIHFQTRCWQLIDGPQKAEKPVVNYNSCPLNDTLRANTVNSMRGFVVSEYLHPSRITVSSAVPEPEAGDGQVLVDVYSAGLNYFDVRTPARAPFQSITLTSNLQILQTQGKYQIKPPLPFVLGTEFAGRISKDSPIPKGCPFKHGDRVFGAGQGTYADKIAVVHTQVRPLPDAMTYDQGAGVWFCELDYSLLKHDPGLYITWPTSYEGLVGRAELRPGLWCAGLLDVCLFPLLSGEHVLVTAAAGGVGIAAVQIAKGVVNESIHGQRNEWPLLF